MVLPQLISHHLKHGDDAEFYRLQARDAIAWLRKKGVPLNSSTSAIDLGCGHGVFGEELLKDSCNVTFSDEQNFLIDRLRHHPFRQFNIDTEDVSSLGEFDLVICSNVYEHLSKPDQFLAGLHRCVKPGGFFYLSWTNWLSPWGGHEFSPFHYFGPRLGPRLADRFTGKKRKHTPYENLFPTSIGHAMRQLKRNKHLRIAAAAPRYYPEFSVVTYIPILREFVTWNCALLLRRQK
ncbi:MAG TPA: class I SAM-dependent methyltransferase [Verrucomicrobiae bacterium]